MRPLSLLLQTALLLLAALALPSVTAQDSNSFYDIDIQSILSEGHPTIVDESGIGGTGLILETEEEGIGGTGIMASTDDEGIGGTGIIGEITGFGSIIVNGVHVDYDSRMVVDNHLQMMTAKQLQVGQVVKVEAVPVGERYKATSLSLQQPIIGPITEISPSRDSIQVMGQEVLLDGSNLKQPFTHSLQVGDPISVSGLWEGDRIHATHLERAPGELASVSGPVDIREHQTYIGQVPINQNNHHLQELQAGTEASAIGKPSNNQRAINLTRSVTSHETPFGRHIKDVLIEGYPRAGKRGLHMGNLRMSGKGLQSGKRQVIRGSLSGKNQIEVIQRPSTNRKSNNLFKGDSSFGGDSKPAQQLDVNRSRRPESNGRRRMPASGTAGSRGGGRR